MASVQQLPSGRWRLSVYTGKDPLTGKKLYEKRTIDAAGKRAAQTEANRWELELRDGEVTGEGGTFRQLTSAWLKVAARRMSPSTLQETEGMIRRYLLGPLGGVDVDKIRTRTLDTLYGELAERGGRCQRRTCARTPCPEGRARCQRRTCQHPPCEAHGGKCADWVPCETSPCQHGGPLAVATVARVHGVVHAALEQARVWGWVRRNVADDATPGQVIEEEIDPPGEEDVIGLLADLDQADRRLADYVTVSIDTGARRGAMHATRWSHINLEVGTIRFPRVIVKRKGEGRGRRDPAQHLVDRPASRTKNTARQAVALSPYTVARLRTRHLEAKQRAIAAGAALPDDAYVWTDDPTGRVPWHPDSTSRRFRLARGGAGLSETRLHDLRHAMATILLAAQIDPAVVAGRGGWLRVATMLERYAHVLPAADRRAAEVMGRVFGAGQGLESAQAE